MDLEKFILFEDTRFIVLNKPAGMAVHGVVENSFGVIETLRKLRPNAAYLELAHRLDKATSGCLVVAKRKSALRAFQKQQENRGVDKRYLALLKGMWQGAHRKVDTALQKVVTKDGKWTVRADESKGKRAVSYFSPVEIHKKSSLVQIKIITGRTHQIRVHAAHIGYPIAGDTKYGDETFNHSMLGEGIHRLCLHAESIKFSLPNIAEYHIQAPVDCFGMCQVSALQDANGMVCSGLSV